MFTRIGIVLWRVKIRVHAVRHAEFEKPALLRHRDQSEPKKSSTTLRRRKVLPRFMLRYFPTALL
jgi:hypothetical protein